MSLSEILTQCRNDNDKIRSEAEKRLDNMAMNDFGQLLEGCARELAGESNPKENRQLCATLIKNMILYQPKHQGKWEQLGHEIKFTIKNYVISCLASNVKEVRKAAAVTVAGICKLEIPRGEWPNIINILIETSSNQDINIRMSSLITIGYISQELMPGHLSSEEVDAILCALINNLRADIDLEIISVAIVAFLNFIVFAKKNMEVANERDVIMNVIFSCLSHHSVDIRVIAMQCLVEISRLYYDYLGSHIEKIIQITEHHMRNDDEKVSIQAYEFWCSVSDEEVIRQNNKSNKYCERALDGLFEVIQFHLLNRNAEIERMNEDAWSNVKAASCLLHNLSQCTNESLIGKVFDLISNNLNSESPKIRDSVILAFGSVLVTNHRSKIKETIPGAIPVLLNMLNDKSYEVRTTMSWCLKKITEYHADCITDLQLFDLFMNTIINSLNSNKRVVVQLCDCIHYIAMNLRPDFVNGDTSGYISKYMNQLLTILLQIAFTKDAYDPNQNVALAAFFCMGSLIDYAPLDTYSIINSFFSNIYAAFDSTLISKNFQKDEIRYAYQSYIATVISACAVGQKVKMNIEEAASVYNLIKSSFVQRQTVYEEGLMACSSLALALGPDFQSIMKDFGSYVVYGLNQWQDASICRISINSTSDLLRAMGSIMNEYIPQLIPIILDILEVNLKYFINLI
jgi:importin subunit beta-1